uniref:Calcium/calmodulin-dependent serine protein kinase (MAGUK family) n=1 Tax=Schistosoma japonicum TaxID=6182 RepID=C1LRH5_SCHJA|nr:calcium/calmodulin-dependent serine protein kinase (MAGUK family) [Schistosoma japonicum]
MAYVLCCLTTISMYFIILFVDNISANNRYYLVSKVQKSIQPLYGKYTFHSNKSNMIKVIGFNINVHGQTFKSFNILLSGEVYMANEFRNGSSMRSFKIVDAEYNFQQVITTDHNDSFVIMWPLSSICEFNPYTSFTVYMRIYGNGNVEYYIDNVWRSTENCFLQIEISDGTCQMNTDGSVTMLGKRVIKTAKYLASSMRNGYMIEFTPRSDITVDYWDYTSYDVSEKSNFSKQQEKIEFNHHYNKSIMIRDIGIVITLHWHNLKSAYISQHGVVNMADKFRNGISMRSFGIVGAISRDGAFATATKNDSFHIMWYNLKICKFDSETLVDLQMSFHRDGIVQFELVFQRPTNCYLTMEILDGFCQMNTDGSVTMVEKKVRKLASYSSSRIFLRNRFEFTPRSNLSWVH